MKSFPTKSMKVTAKEDGYDIEGETIKKKSIKFEKTGSNPENEL